MENYTLEDAEDAQKNFELVQLVKDGVINPRPVFDLIKFHEVFGFEKENEPIDLEVPAYARKFEVSA